MKKQQSEYVPEWFAFGMAIFCLIIVGLNLSELMRLRNGTIQVYHTNYFDIGALRSEPVYVEVYHTNEVFIGREVWHTNQVTNYNNLTGQLWIEPHFDHMLTNPPYHEYLNHIPMTPTYTNYLITNNTYHGW